MVFIRDTPNKGALLLGLRGFKCKNHGTTRGTTNGTKGRRTITGLEQVYGTTNGTTIVYYSVHIQE